MNPNFYDFAILFASCAVCFFFGLRHERRKHKDAILWARSAAYAEGRRDALKAENKETR